ncbi:IS4 family transposase [Rubritalea spongiae]|uniref:IS4 family transposase n=1 Tax=Rubritalea spongiae TaxID=430797 RepID=UPI0036206B78
MSLHISILTTLRQQVGGNLSRLKCLADIIFAITKSRSVNLVKLATDSQMECSQSSRYRRFQRFFATWELPMLAITQLILGKIPKPKDGYILSIDRTNWQFGKTHINILTIGVIVGKIAVPLVWQTLPQTSKRGNSNTKLRIGLMSKLLEVLPAKDIYFIAMDREFHGKRWLAWLDKKEVTFVLRIKANTIVGDLLAMECKRSRVERQSIWGMNLYFGKKEVRTQRTQTLYVVSNRFKSKKALNAYQRRWGIEVLFGHFKKKGLNIEDTHLREAKRVDTLVAVVTLSFFFCFSWGVILKHNKTLPAYIKRKSYFRAGLEHVIEMLNHPKRLEQLWNQFLGWIDNGAFPKKIVV